MTSINYSLPAAWYVDPDHFNKERIAIFGREWLFAAPVSRFGKPGDYVTVSIMGYEIVLIKQNDGSIKAFRNVCRHRASQLLTGSGTCKGNCITCPYHSWTFEIDGKLRKAPKFDEIENFCKDDYSLYPVTLKEADGLLFVNLNPSSSEDPRFATLHQVLSGYPLDRYSYHSVKTFDLACNWKTWVENYQECYHCRTIHPLLNRNFDLNKYRVVNANKVCHHMCPRKDVDPEKARPGDAELQCRDGFWIFMYPNLAIGLYETYYDTMEIVPMGPDKTRLVVTFYGRKDVNPDELRCNIEAVSFQTYYEDIQACESVHKGLVATQDLNKPVGPLHPIREDAVIYFDSLVRTSMELTQPENSTTSSASTTSVRLNKSCDTKTDCDCRCGSLCK